MVRKCIDAIHAATGKVFSDEEASAMVDRLIDRARQAGRKDPTLAQQAAVAQAAAELTHEELMTSLLAQRLRVKTRIATAYRTARIDAMPKTMTPAARLRAFDVGSEKQGMGTSASVDAISRARAAERLGQMKMGLDQRPGLVDRAANFYRQDNDFEYKMADELARLNGDGAIEPTGDEDALHFARVASKALDDTREAQNAQGAWIAKREGYIARQSHDPTKIAGSFWKALGQMADQLKARGINDWRGARTEAAMEPWREWRDYQLEHLSDKTYEGLEHQDMDAAKAAEAAHLSEIGMLDDPRDLRELFLYHAFCDIISGSREEMRGADDESEFRAPASLARQVSKARVFIYKSPREWVDYNRKYGSGTLMKSIVAQLERGERNAELMRAYGPSPDAGHDAEIARLSAEARGNGKPNQIKQLKGWQVRATFEAVTGRLNAPENVRLAHIMATLRRWEGLTKLGAIVLSKFTDIPLGGHVMARAGGRFLDGYKGSTAGILRLGSKDAKRAAEALHVGARAFAGHISGQYSEADGALGLTTWLTRLEYKVNGFEWMNEGDRKGIGQAWSRMMGQEAEHPWEGVSAGAQESMQRFGIGPDEWEAARHDLPTASDGLKYLTLDHIEDIPESRLNAAERGELKMRFLTMAHNVFDDATSEPRLREQVAMTFGTRPGTVAGEVFRSFGQMKGFLTAVVGRHVVPAARGYAGRSPVALLAHMVAGTAIAGYFSLNAHLIAKGLAPRSPFNEDGTPDLAVWGAALAQGGGLGIYGDFLVGEKNRSGADFGVGSLGGPLVSDAEQVARVIFQASHGNTDHLSGELTRLGVHNVPFSNLFYAQLAFNYLLFWRLEEASSPGYLRRYEANQRRDQNAHFLLAPTSAQ